MSALARMATVLPACVSAVITGAHLKELLVFIDKSSAPESRFSSMDAVMNITGAHYCSCGSGKSRKEVRDAFTATVMLMLIMMVIRSGPLSCEANFLLPRATEREEHPPPPPTSPTCKCKKSCRVDVYSYKWNQFADTVETSEEKLPISLTTAVEIHDGERATIITGGN